MRKLSLLPLLSLLLAPVVGRGEDDLTAILKKPAFPGTRLQFSEGCVPTGGVVGKTTITFARTGAANYVDAAGALQSCAENAARVDPGGVRVEPARTNLYPNNIANNWTTSGTATAVRDGPLVPGSPIYMVKIGGLGAEFTSAVNVNLSDTGATAGSYVGTGFWFRRATTSGVIGVHPTASGSAGEITIDLAQLPDTDVWIGANSRPGVTYTAWKVGTGGTTGLRFYAVSGSPSAWVGQPQREAGPYATTPIVSFSVVTANAMNSPGDLTTASWTKRGTAAVTKDGTLGPSGAQASLITGLGAAGTNDVFQSRTGLTANAMARTIVRIRKVSTSGTLTIGNSWSTASGLITVDLSVLPEGWQEIGSDAVPGVTITNQWTTTAGGNIAVQLAATAGAPLSVYVDTITQPLYTASTRAAETLTIPSPLQAGDTSWCVDAGMAWTMGTGANSASLAYTSTSLVFTVTDAASGTKTVTSLLPGTGAQHQVIACSDGGTLSLTLDGYAVGVPGGSGTGVISTYPANLVITEIAGPASRITILRKGDPSRILGSAPAPSLYVVMNFDDGTINQLTNGMPIFEAKGVRATFYMIMDYAGMSASYLTYAQMQNMAARGAEIGSHSLTHASQQTSQIPASRIYREACASRNRLLGLGIPVRTAAYPFGHSDATTHAAMAACGYGAARTVAGYDATGHEQVPPPNAYYVRTEGYYNLADALAKLDIADQNLPARNGRTAVFSIYSHHIDDASASRWEPANLAAFIDAVKARAPRMQIVTMAEAYGLTTQPPAAAQSDGQPLILEGTMESYIGGASGAPDCWERSSAGVTTATWSRVTGRTGYAQQVVASGWTTGPVRLQEDTAAYSACSIPAAVARTYTISCWYKSDVPVRLDARRLLDSNKTFSAWQQSGTFAASPSTWAQASWTTPAVPADTLALSAGIGIVDGVCASGCLGANSTATLVVDDCSAVENP